MKSLKRALIIINLKAVIVTALAVLSTWFCMREGIQADYPLTLIATAIVFPIVFSIGGAYKRREEALDKYGEMKSHGMAIYFATRDWLESPSEELLTDIRTKLGNIFTNSRTLFTDDLVHLRKHEDEVYESFSDLSKFIKNGLRANGLAGGEVSRCNQYFSKMMLAFEDIKHVYQYRTPRTLRTFSDIFITVLPPLYGPYFAHVSGDYSPGLAYVMPVLFSLILVSLDNIQGHLENPFDQVGEDDLTINVEEFVERLH